MAQAVPNGTGSEPPTLMKTLTMNTSLPDEAPPSSYMSLEDPRMVVAMQILGCSVEDLTSPGPPAPQPRSVPGDVGKSPRKVVSVVTPARRQELWERKQQNLWREVEAEAKSKRVEKILMRKFEEEEEEEYLQPDAASLEAIKQRSQAEIQRAIDTEKNKLEKIAACQQKKLDIEKQVKKSQSDAKEKLVAAMEVRQAWRENQGKKFEEETKRRRKKAGELVAKLKLSFKKVEEHKAETLQNWERVKEENAYKMEEVAYRHEQLLREDQEEKVRDYLEKEARTQERLEEKRERDRERAEKGEAEYLEKLEISLRELEAKQQLREERFMESLERQEKAAQELVKEHQKIRDKAQKYWTDKVEPVLDKKRKEEEKFQERLRRRAKKFRTQPQGGPVSPRKLKVLQDETQRRVELRASMDEIVQQNLQRLQRGQEFMTDRLLTRIEENNARTDELHEKRATRHLKREAIMKEALIEKARVHEELRTMKVIPTPIAENEEKEKESK